MLVRVVSEVLSSLGKHHSIDLGFGILANEGNMLIDLGQSGAQCTDGPLELGFAVDDGPLVGKMPDLVTPVLEIDIPEAGTRFNDQLNRTAVEAGAIGGGTGGFRQ